MLDVEDLKLVIDDLRLLGEPPLLDAGELALDEVSVAGLTLQVILAFSLAESLGGIHSYYCCIPVIST